MVYAARPPKGPCLDSLVSTLVWRVLISFYNDSGDHVKGGRGSKRNIPEIDPAGPMPGSEAMHEIDNKKNSGSKHSNGQHGVEQQRPFISVFVNLLFH